MIAKISQPLTFRAHFIDSDGEGITGLSPTINVLKPDDSNYVLGAAMSEISAANHPGSYEYTVVANDNDQTGLWFATADTTDSSVTQKEIVMQWVVEVVYPAAIEWEYTVTNTATGNPEPGVQVWITTDNDVNGNIIWRGVTDTFGVARETLQNSKPFLAAGTYYFWKFKTGFIDPQYPDIEVVS